jgi:hypothetical protein
MRLKMASLRFCDDSIVSTALRSRLEQDLLESIATQILVKFVILKHAAAWKSRPHPVLIATSLSALAAAPLLVFSPTAAAFDCVSVPIQLAVTIVVVVLAYLACAELAKRWGGRTTVARAEKKSR